MHKRFIQFLLLALGLIGLDQLVKYLSVQAVQGVSGKSIHSLWSGVFELKLVYNEGVAFGMFQGAGVLLTPIAILIAGYAIFFSWKHPKENIWSHLTMAFLAGGSIGNLIDRLTLGKVVDMFWIRLIDFPVFNIADVCITIAGTMIVLSVIREIVQKGKKEESLASAQELKPTETEPEA